MVLPRTGFPKAWSGGGKISFRSMTEGEFIPEKNRSAV